VIDDIDVETDPANLTWAINRGHSADYARAVYEELDKVVSKGTKQGLGREELAGMIRGRLRKLGELITDGEFP
jgi:hypothetical protein